MTTIATIASPVGSRIVAVTARTLSVLTVLTRIASGAHGLLLLLERALTQSTTVPGWLGVLGVLGVIIGPVLMLCSLKFVGGHERSGWRVAERLTPDTYIAWSLWLMATGGALLA